MKVVDQATQRMADRFSKQADRLLAVATRADEIVEEVFGPAPRTVTLEQSNACWAKAEAEVNARTVERFNGSDDTIRSGLA